MIKASFFSSHKKGFNKQGAHKYQHPGKRVSYLKPTVQPCKSHMQVDSDKGR